MHKPLPLSYYQNRDVLFLGKDLLGKLLFTQINGVVTCGIINETESYRGPDDKACHAYNFRRTERNKMMYAVGGHSYVYMCYGMHYLFNIVTSVLDEPHAVLIRSIYPLIGQHIMHKRRKSTTDYPHLTYGPGKTAQALGIDRSFNGERLDSKKIWIQESLITVDSNKIEELPRVGVDYAGEHARLPWRFRIENSWLETIIANMSLSAQLGE